jgi:hypothetical protein
MTDLFRSGAATQAEALQQAQERMQKEARFSHPYDWAPFTLVGDGARPIPSGKPASGHGETARGPDGAGREGGPAPRS